MGDGNVAAKLGNMKAVLGLVAGAGASYGIYKLLSGESFKKNKRDVTSRESGSQRSEATLQPGSLVAKVSGLDVVCRRPVDKDDVGVASGQVVHQSAGNLEPQHLRMLLSCLQSSGSAQQRCQILLTLGNASAFTVNQNLIREFEGIPIIASFLSDPAADVRVQCLNALNNLCMNILNQECIKMYVSQVLELIEMSPVNSDLQLSALRLLTNLAVTDDHQHLLKKSITLLLSLLVVSNETLQIQSLKLLLNLSSNPDMMDDIVQAQAPASVLLLFDLNTAPSVLSRLLSFAGNLKAWTPSAQVADELRQKLDSVFRVMLDDSSELHSRLIKLLSHPDEDIQSQVARILT